MPVCIIFAIFAVMKRGRSKVLVAARDRRMFERYFYWTEVRRLRFDDAIRKLSEEEFFVSEGRVMQVVRRMIQEGATVEGRQIEKPLFTGFKGTARRKATPSDAPVPDMPLFPGFPQ